MLAAILQEMSNCYCLPGRAGGSPADVRAAEFQLFDPKADGGAISGLGHSTVAVMLRWPQRGQESTRHAALSLHAILDKGFHFRGQSVGSRQSEPMPRI
jgi:hypothetical protein